MTRYSTHPGDEPAPEPGKAGPGGVFPWFDRSAEHGEERTEILRTGTPAPAGPPEEERTVIIPAGQKASAADTEEPTGPIDADRSGAEDTAAGDEVGERTVRLPTDGSGESTPGSPDRDGDEPADGAAEPADHPDHPGDDEQTADIPAGEAAEVPAEDLAEPDEPGESGEPDEPAEPGESDVLDEPDEVDEPEASAEPAGPGAADGPAEAAGTGDRAGADDEHATELGSAPEEPTRILTRPVAAESTSPEDPDDAPGGSDSAAASEPPEPPESTEPAEPEASEEPTEQFKSGAGPDADATPSEPAGAETAAGGSDSGEAEPVEPGPAASEQPAEERTDRIRVEPGPAASEQPAEEPTDRIPAGAAEPDEPTRIIRPGEPVDPEPAAEEAAESPAEAAPEATEPAAEPDTEPEPVGSASVAEESRAVQEPESVEPSWQEPDQPATGRATVPDLEAWPSWPGSEPTTGPISGPVSVEWQQRDEDTRSDLPTGAETAEAADHPAEAAEQPAEPPEPSEPETPVGPVAEETGSDEAAEPTGVIDRPAEPTAEPVVEQPAEPTDRDEPDQPAEPPEPPAGTAGTPPEIPDIWRPAPSEPRARGTATVPVPPPEPGPVSPAPPVPPSVGRATVPAPRTVGTASVPVPPPSAQSPTVGRASVPVVPPAAPTTDRVPVGMAAVSAPPAPTSAPPGVARPTAVPVPRRKRRGLLIGVLGLVAVLVLAGGALVVLRPGPIGALLGAGAAAPSEAPVPTPSPVLAAVNTGAPVPTTAGLGQELGPLMQDGRLGNSSGAVLDVATGAQLYGDNAGGLQTPASITKLVTSTAVLQARGPGYRFQTRAVAGSQPGEVVLIGGGDPTLAVDGNGTYPGAARLDLLAAQVRQALGGTAPTRVVVDSSLFATPTTGPGWDSGDTTAGNAVAAPITALMVNGGRTSPVPLSSEGTPRSAEPDLAAGQKFAEQLGLSGSTVSRGSAPAGARQLGAVASMPLVDIVEHMLQFSDNTIAEVLSHQVALAKGKPATFEGGAEATRQVLGELGLSIDGEQLVDGSGLSRTDKLSPAFLTRLLVLVAGGKHPNLWPVYTGLPVAGYSGTLDNRYQNASTGIGLVRAKTGTLSGVNTLAGLVVDADGRLLAFTLMAENSTSSDGAEAALDKVAGAMAGCGCR